METSAEQAEEIEALIAIYDQDFIVIDEANRIYEIRICHQSDSWWSATLQVLLPPQYPDRVPPVFEIHSAWMSDADMFEASDLLYTIYREHQGQIIIYQWVEALRTFIDNKFNDQEPIDAKGSRSDVSLKYHGENIKLSETIEDGDSEKDQTANLSCNGEDALKLIRSERSDLCPEITHGEPFTDRKSTFQAHLAHVIILDQVSGVLQELKKNRKVNNATHNVMAYRIFCKDRNCFLQDCDDDGEAAAGSRLLHLLQILNVRDVVVVVTRWYGGILLGPDRFKHYNNCARNLMKDAGLIDISPQFKESKLKSRFKPGKRQ